MRKEMGATASRTRDTFTPPFLPAHDLVVQPVCRSGRSLVRRCGQPTLQRPSRPTWGRVHTHVLASFNVSVYSYNPHSTTAGLQCASHGAHEAWPNRRNTPHHASTHAHKVPQLVSHVPLGSSWPPDKISHSSRMPFLMWQAAPLVADTQRSKSKNRLAQQAGTEHRATRGPTRHERGSLQFAVQLWPCWRLLSCSFRTRLPFFWGVHLVFCSPSQVYRPMRKLLA